MTARRVLIGTAGTGTSFGVLSSLKEAFPNSYVLATDVAASHVIAASAIADDFAQVPALLDPAFADTLLGLIVDHAIDSYVPTHDLEVIVAGELREADRLGEVACAAPPSWSAKLCWDKLALASWLETQGLPTPRTRNAADIENLEGGWIVKPRRGVGSVDVRRITTEEELQLHRNAHTESEAIAQPLLSGPEITVDAFLAQDGSGGALCRERIEVKSGVCTKARIFHDLAVEDIALAAGRALAFRGAFCVQLMADSRGAWLLTDVNPRPGAGTRLSVAVGFNVHAAMFADLWGEDPGPYLEAVEGERWAVRQYREIVLV